MLTAVGTPATSGNPTIARTSVNLDTQVVERPAITDRKKVTAWTTATARTIITAGAQGTQTAAESTATAEAPATAVLLAAVGTPAAAAAGTPLAASSQENPRPSPRDPVKISIFYTSYEVVTYFKSVFEQNSLVSKCKFYKLFLLR
jgi:hypothetical protein